MSIAEQIRSRWFSSPGKPKPVNPYPLIERGRQAEALLKNETLSGAMEEMLRECSLAWISSSPMDYDARTELYLRAQAIQAFRAKLQGWLTDAQVEAANLETRERRKKEI